MLEAVKLTRQRTCRWLGRRKGEINGSRDERRKSAFAWRHLAEQMLSDVTR